MDTILSTEIKFLQGVGPQRAAILASEAEVHTFGDLVHYYPYKYTDRSKFFKVSEVRTDEVYVQVKGKFSMFDLSGTRNRQRLTARFSDESGSLEVIWFQGIKYIQQSVVPGKEYILYGKPSIYNGRLSIPHPELDDPEKLSELALRSTLQAAYPTTEKMKSNYLNSKAIQKLQANLWQKISGRIPETLPEHLLKKLQLPGINDTLQQIHFPTDAEALRRARFRMKFEELLLIQLNLLSQKVWRQHHFKGFIFNKVGDLFHAFYRKHLPFELTSAQKRVIREIRSDLGSSRQMNRLMQGDVGSGKTLVALLVMLIALDNGYQACLMAPTEILAQQHFQTFSRMLQHLPVEVRLLTGSTKNPERARLHTELKNHQAGILIGTHALIEDQVGFANLGLVVIDEQHRFGVAQRARLWQKTELHHPHVLVMTATPIPRTLAMTLYGDLDISVIDEMPPGRKPIKTVHYYDSRRLRVFDFIKKQIASGRQIYIVYPLIQESEALDYKNLYDGYESITRAFPPPDYAVSVLHGQMKPEEKKKAMDYFVKGITHIMVSTTVIEVGVDVPNATVMMIESAERFGLSQLHQLRGRVGRGDEQSYCILMSGVKLTKEARTRLQTMTESNDGFEIAEVDLKLRGPGDLEGTQQSGMPIHLKIASLAKDGRILELARRYATDILDEDPDLTNTDHACLKRQLQNMMAQLGNWGRIS